MPGSRPRPFTGSGAARYHPNPLAPPGTPSVRRPADCRRRRAEITFHASPRGASAGWRADHGDLEDPGTAVKAERGRAPRGGWAWSRSVSVLTFASSTTGAAPVRITSLTFGRHRRSPCARRSSRPRRPHSAHRPSTSCTRFTRRDPDAIYERLHWVDFDGEAHEARDVGGLRGRLELRGVPMSRMRHPAMHPARAEPGRGVPDPADFRQNSPLLRHATH